MKNTNDPLGNRTRNIPTCRCRSASNNCATMLTSVRSRLDIVFQSQCGVNGILFAKIFVECTYVLLCAKISVNYNGFCVATSFFTIPILSVVRKEDLMVSACLCAHVIHPTLQTCPTRCPYFSRRVEFEA
jgi:hypothetical protein